MKKEEVIEIVHGVLAKKEKAIASLVPLHVGQELRRIKKDKEKKFEKDIMQLFSYIGIIASMVLCIGACVWAVKYILTLLS